MRCEKCHGTGHVYERAQCDLGDPVLSIQRPCPECGGRADPLKRPVDGCLGFAGQKHLAHFSHLQVPVVVLPVP